MTMTDPTLDSTDLPDAPPGFPTDEDSFEAQLGAAVKANVERLQGQLPDLPPPAAEDEPVSTEEPNPAPTDAPPAAPGTETSSSGDLDTPPAPPAASTSASLGADEDDDQEPATPPRGPVTFQVPLEDGTTATLTDAQIRGLMGLSGWAHSLPEETRQSFAAIESGRAVAIPREEYELYAAWRNAGGQQQQLTQDDLDWEDMTPAQQRAFQQLYQQNQQLSQYVQQVQQQPDPRLVQQSTQQIEQRTEQFRQATASWAASRGLDDETREQILRRAIDSGVISTLVQNQRSYNPVNGQVIREADYDLVARQAMDFALTLDPELHQRVVANSLTPQQISSTPPPTQSPGSSTRAAVESRKARASSLASAPAASVPQPPSDPRQMTPQQRQAAMAAAIAAANSTG